MPHRVPRILVCCALLVSAAAYAEPAVYQWRDASGALVFSDRPPPGAEQPVASEVLPSANVIGRFRPLPRPPAAPTRPRPARKATRVQSGHKDRCQDRRMRLDELWAQRRRGYRAGEGESIRTAIRELQAALKQDCGHWR